MDKKFLLAIVLSFLVIYGWQAMFPPPKPVPPPQAAPKVATDAGGSASSAAPGAPASTGASPSQAVEAETAKPLVAASADQDIVVESDAVLAVFSTKGAVLKSWRLKKYFDDKGAPLELVPANVPNATKPFSLDIVDNQAVTAKLRTALFKPDRERLDVTGDASSLNFEYRDAAGLVARKTFTFSAAQPYLLHFTADITENDKVLNPAVQWGPAINTGVVAGGMIYAPASQPIFYRDRKVTRVQIKNIDQHRQEQGAFGFAGVDDHYFLSAIIPTAQTLDLRYEPMLVPVEGETQPRQFIAWTVREPAPPKDAVFFFGPKDLDVLQHVKPDLIRAIDFGMFDWLVVPLLRALKWLNGYIGNYGWSIIALTVIINIIIFPLRHKSVVSMRKMQEIQPQLKAIQDRYAKLKVTDPAKQKMNEEVMALYRQSGANPATGCVPTLLTFPVLLAFYAMLSVAIELRGAPFVGWIHDLSIHDPWYVLPVLMGITMFVQQRMTPTSADPVQQKMMMFMPIMFTGMLMRAPVGLVVYWTVSNLWGIGQTTITNRLIGPPPQHAVRPPAERQLKTAGAGKTTQAAKERK
jgi:YidC/Oxa1 family membrane protein insertase